MTIRDLLGIELPIIQAPMAGVQGAALASSVHREALKSDASRVTALTNVFSGRPARGIVNRLMRELGYMSEAAPPFPLASTALAPLRAAAEKHGSGDFSPRGRGEAREWRLLAALVRSERDRLQGDPGSSAHTRARERWSSRRRSR